MDLNSNQPPCTIFKLPQPFRFVNLLGHSPIEYNQEQARLRTYSGEESLIRSFPYAVFDSNICAYKTHTPLPTHCFVADPKLG